MQQIYLSVRQRQQVVSLSTVCNRLDVLDAAIAVNMNPGTGELWVAIGTPDGLIAVLLYVRDHLVACRRAGLAGIGSIRVSDPPQHADVFVPLSAGHPLGHALDRTHDYTSSPFFLDWALPKDTQALRH
jgi:hypothetical protein